MQAPEVPPPSTKHAVSDCQKSNENKQRKKKGARSKRSKTQVDSCSSDPVGAQKDWTAIHSNTPLHFHTLYDISRGEERIKICVINQVNSLFPPSFRYITKSTIYENARVDFGLARISDKDCCSTCFGDCVISPRPCMCTRETGGEFAYTRDGILRGEFLDKCIETTSKPPNDCLYYCKDCSKKGLGECQGHIVRMFIKECWSKCGCDKNCGNRVVQRGITCKLQVFYTGEAKGWGLRATEDLPRGAFVCEYVGEILTNTELAKRNEEETSHYGNHTYPMLLNADWGTEDRLNDDEALCLDATRFGNVARFINHRCSDANLFDIPVEIENPDHHYYHVAFFTNRPTRALEELTRDYGTEFDDLTHPIKAFQCHCGSKYCRDLSEKRSPMVHQK